MANKSQRFLTLATKNDWAPVLSSFEGMLAIKYVESGMFSDSNPAEYATFRALPKFGEAIVGDAVQERRYLIMKEGAPVCSRIVRLNTGESRFVVDHENNPESLVFSAGGVLQAPKAVIQGEVSNLSTLESADELFVALSRLIKKHFSAVKAYRVGPEALSLRGEGYRLTASVRGPLEYDLSINGPGIER